MALNVNSKPQKQSQKLKDKLKWSKIRLENGNKLRLYRLFKERIDVDSYIRNNMPKKYRQMIAKLRIYI